MSLEKTEINYIYQINLYIFKKRLFVLACSVTLIDISLQLTFDNLNMNPFSYPELVLQGTL